MSKPVVTGEMVTAFRVAFDDESKRTDYLNYNGSIRVGIEAALSASPAEPVGYVPASGMADLQAGGCTWLVKPMSIEGVEDDYIPVFASPVHETERMREDVNGPIDPRHFDILAEAMAEIKATSDGLSCQPISEIVACCLEEIAALGRKP